MKILITGFILFISSLLTVAPGYFYSADQDSPSPDAEYLQESQDELSAYPSDVLTIHTSSPQSKKTRREAASAEIGEEEESESLLKKHQLVKSIIIAVLFDAIDNKKV